MCGVYCKKEENIYTVVRVYGAVLGSCNGIIANGARVQFVGDPFGRTNQLMDA